jgi:hypothetical protein
MSQEKTKDPQAFLDYFIDWGTWLVAGDSIGSAVWTVPTGLTEEAATVDGTKAIVWLSGGTSGQSYTVTCHVVMTPSGREDDRSLTINMEER